LLLYLFFDPEEGRAPKFRLTLNALHGVISQKIQLVTTTAVRVSDLTYIEEGQQKFRIKSNTVLPVSALSLFDSQNITYLICILCPKCVVNNDAAVTLINVH
jgi:hypothetical protein